MPAFRTPVYGQDEHGRMVSLPDIQAREVGPGKFVCGEIDPDVLWTETELLSWCTSNGRSLVVHKREQ